MTGKEFVNKYNQEQMEEIARDIAGSIVIRTYHNGNSCDTRRETTPEEKEIIRKIALSVMYSYAFYNSEIDSILNVAEFTIDMIIPNVNGYDTLYIPLRKVTQTGGWKQEVVMPKIFKGKNIFGKRVIRVDDYEICKGSCGWEIVKLQPYARCTSYFGLWDKVPTFPNMMQAYRFLKENWAEMM